MKTMIVTLCFLFLVGLRAYPEPSPTVNFLTKESVSLFTFGMFRLQYYFDSNTDLKPIWKVFLNYTRVDNKITLTGSVFYSPEMGNPKQVCKNTIEKIRELGLVNPQTGKYKRALVNFSRYAEFFGPYGRRLSDWRLYKEIDKLIIVKGRVVRNYDDLAHCQGPLVSSEILFG